LLCARIIADRISFDKPELHRSSLCYADCVRIAVITMRGTGDMRAGEWLYRVVVGLSGFGLTLVIVYIILVQDNRSVQLQVNQRQQFINQSMQLGRVNEALIRALAAAAVNNKDDKLRDLLAQHGITINAAGEPVPSIATPPPEKSPPAAEGKTQ
jgi:hypothetical protein